MIVVFIWFSTTIDAQSYQLEVQAIDKTTDFLARNIEYDSSIPDTPQLTATLRTIQQDLQAQGYLAASVDSIFLKDSLTYLAQIYVGDFYQWLALRNGNVEETWLSKAGFREQLYSNKTLKIQQIKKLQDALLEEAENNGFPFAKTHLDSIEITAGKVSAAILLDKGNYIEIDTIRIHGAVQITKKYLENYLGILPNSPYDKSKILSISQRLQELPFLKETQTVDVIFYGNRAVINIYVQPERASRFDFIVGILPTTVSNGTVERTTFTITGDLKGEFHNAFGFGAYFAVQLEQLRPLTPRLNVSATYPYILNTSFGADASLRIFKQDTSFLEVSADLGIRYLLESNDYIKAFWSNQGSNLLEVDTMRVKQQGRLPQQLDFQYNAFGLEYQQENLDYRLNPRKGWQVFARAAAGLKNIRPNSRILALSTPEVHFQNLYDSLGLNTFQYNLDVQLAAYIPLGQRSTLQLKNRTAAILSNTLILENEQFRIGGNQLLRGFDEQSILATQYSLFTIEPRLLVDTNSYFYAFLDYAFLRNQANENDFSGYALGFGAGLTLETSVGVFGISLALGQRQNSSLDLRNPKIHFGYVSLF
ncbi:MAG: BamA/TamA family outer membrane protein [Bacteroidota bacterium]